MKFLSLSLFFLLCLVVHVQSGIILQGIDSTLRKIKCRAHTIGNRIFHRDDSDNSCDDAKQNNNGLFSLQTWHRPSTNEGYGQGYVNHYGGGNENVGLNMGYGNGAQLDPNKQQVHALQYGNREQGGYIEEYGRVTPVYPNSDRGYASYSNSGGQFVPTSNGGHNGESSNDNKPHDPSLEQDNKQDKINGKDESQYVPYNSDESVPMNCKNSSTDEGGQNSQKSCTTGDENQIVNQTGSPKNATQNGRRILSNIKANCRPGFVADASGICREEY